jgi:protease I
VAILATDGVELVEFSRPREALIGAGAEVHLLSIEPGQIEAKNRDLEPAGTLDVDRVVGDAKITDYDALVLPGGTVNPDKRRPR